MNRAQRYRLMISILIAGTVVVSEPRVADGEWEAPPRYAIDFNGASTYVDVPHSPILNPSGPFTLEAWVLAHDYQYPGHSEDGFPNDAIVDKRDDVGFGRGYGLFLVEGRPAFAVATEENLDVHVVGPDPVDLNAYYHIAGTWDGEGSIRVFLNGVHVGTTSIPGTHVIGLGTFVIGSRYSHNQYFWMGWSPRSGCRAPADTRLTSFRLTLFELTSTHSGPGCSMRPPAMLPAITQATEMRAQSRTALGSTPSSQSTWTQ